MTGSSVPPQPKHAMLVTMIVTIYPCLGLCDRVSYTNTYIKIGTIQRRLAWSLRKDDTQIREAFRIFNDLI